MTAATDEVVASAMELRGAAPAAWETFVAAMRVHAAMQVSEMLKCPPDMLMKAQGMAQAANEISQILINVSKLYEDLQGRRRKHG